MSGVERTIVRGGRSGKTSVRSTNGAKYGTYGKEISLHLAAESTGEWRLIEAKVANIRADYPNASLADAQQHLNDHDPLLVARAWRNN